MSSFHSYLANRGTAPPSLAEAAIACGLPVFPCGADKRPLTPHGFKDASRDPARIREMFAVPGAIMIGVPTGEDSGITVVDVDIKDGARGQEWLHERSADLPSTRTHKTRSGGLHLVFLAVPGIRNSAGKVAPGVDVRGDGGYVIVPPSPDYVVADHADPTDMPQWLIDACMKRPEPVRATRPTIPTTEGGTPYGLAALDNECEAIRSAPQGTKHHTLNKAAYAVGGLVTAGELQEGVAYSQLGNALADIRSSCRDFRAAQTTLRRAFDEGMGRPRAVPERTPPVEGVHPAETFLASLHKLPPIPVKPELMDVPGALQLFIEHCEDTAMSSQPFLALAAGICLIGTLAGRKYRTATDLRTNIYAVGVADSGAGKDHARKQIKKLLAAAGLTEYLGGEDIASGAAIFTALSLQQSILFQIDEFGDWLTDVLGSKAAPHKKQIAQRLKTLYSSASTFINGIEYADQSKNKRGDIKEPHACLYGTTTPGQLWNAIAGASMNDGLMARILMFVSPCSYPDESDKTDHDPSPELVSALQAIAAGPAIQETGNLVGVVPPGAKLVPNTPAADAAWRALRQEQLAMQRKAEGTYVTAIAGRLAENAMKLALVRAVSRDPADPAIDAGDVAWGRATARHCIDTLLREADRYVADSDYEAKLKKVAELIRKHGPITQPGLLAVGLDHFPARDRTELLQTLVESGRVIAAMGSGPKGGRPALRYSISGTSETSGVLDD